MLSIIQCLKKVLTGFKGVPKYEVVYTNPDPEAGFEAQKVDIPGITKYDFLLLEAHTSTSFVALATYIIPVVVGKTFNMQRFYNVTSTNTPGFVDRGITVEEDGLSFTLCRIKGVNSTNVSTAYGKTWLIPDKIYGIKLHGGG